MQGSSRAVDSRPPPGVTQPPTPPHHNTGARPGPAAVRVKSRRPSRGACLPACLPSCLPALPPSSMTESGVGTPLVPVRVHLTAAGECHATLFVSVYVHAHATDSSALSSRLLPTSPHPISPQPRRPRPARRCPRRRPRPQTWLLRPSSPSPSPSPTAPPWPPPPSTPRAGRTRRL